MPEAQLPLLVIGGPTASGKTGWALRLAEQFDIEIISADSRQVYRQMDIGTAKATLEEQGRVPHHLIDLIDPDQEFSVAEFVDRARPLVEEICRRGRLPCVVGGTGLYIRALLGGMAPLPPADEPLREQLRQQEAAAGEGSLHRLLQQVDPVSAERIHPRNLVRVIRALEVQRLSGRRMSELQDGHRFADRPYRTLKLVPAWPREELYARIDRRVEQMLEAGLVDEVAELINRYGAGAKALKTLGYREVGEYLAGVLSYHGMVEAIQCHTRQYAKRQLTWFQKEAETIWVDSCTESGMVIQSIENLIQR